MASRENNTMAEGLSKIMKDLSQMKLEPDADMPFLISLETDILNYLKPPVPTPQGQPQQQLGPQGAQMAPAMGAVMGGGGGPMAGGPAPGPMGSGVATVGMGMPNPDEFRRGLGQAALRGASRQLVHRMLNTIPATGT